VRRIDWERCSQCLQCVEACIFGALETAGKQMSVDEIVREAEKDAIFYKNSGGGVTVSGGEPLLQHEFLAELIQKLKEKKSHSTVDTSGYAPKAVLKKIVENADLVFFDIKHLEAAIHRAYTGVDNDVILKNASYLAKRVTTWFRMALIADVNDSVGHIQQVSGLAAELGVEKLSLLPYNEGGKSKCRQIGKVYEIEGRRTPSDDHIENIIQVAARQGIAATVRH
jgi:pyruvate formate lyase activating enzyme